MTVVPTARYVCHGPPPPYVVKVGQRKKKYTVPKIITTALAPCCRSIRGTSEANGKTSFQNQAASTYCIAGDIAPHAHIVRCTLTLDKTDVNVGPRVTHTSNLQLRPIDEIEPTTLRA
jgi:hypothetical protein